MCIRSCSIKNNGDDSPKIITGVKNAHNVSTFASKVHTPQTIGLIELFRKTIQNAIWLTTSFFCYYSRRNSQKLACLVRFDFWVPTCHRPRIPLHIFADVKESCRLSWDMTELMILHDSDDLLTANDGTLLLAFRMETPWMGTRVRRFCFRSCWNDDRFRWVRYCSCDDCFIVRM